MQRCLVMQLENVGMPSLYEHRPVIYNQKSLENERASYNGSIEASQASDVGSIPIARSINPDDSIVLTPLTYQNPPEKRPVLDCSWTELDAIGPKHFGALGPLIPSAQTHRILHAHWGQHSRSDPRFSSASACQASMLSIAVL